MSAPRTTAARNPQRSRAARRGAGATRQPLSRARIVEAALALVDQEGLSALSTRRLGVRLRCEAMSIYHHFPSKQHLLDAMVDHVIGGIELPPGGGDALQRVRETLVAYRAMAHRHPAFFPYVAVHRLNTPTGVRFIDRVLGLIRAAVVDDQLAARYFRVVGYYLVGAALDETAGYAKGPSAAEPVDDATIRAECPELTRAAPYFQRGHWDATFDLGIDALMVAMAADAKPAKAASTPSRRR